jgi:hypothetical protein
LFDHENIKRSDFSILQDISSDKAEWLGPIPHHCADVQGAFSWSSIWGGDYPAACMDTLKRVCSHIQVRDMDSCTVWRMPEFCRFQDVLLSFMEF